MDNKELKKIANTIRGLAIDGVQAANSGHPGLPMGMADVATVLWTKYLKFNPKNPNWYDRDRFVLSGGHGSMLLYSLLHLFNYDLPLSELKRFRQWESQTPGHPEYRETAGVETTTGPLGQGLANAVGMALAESSLAARFNKESNIVDHFTYVMVGDGDLEEGIAHEVASFAGHNQLGKLIVLYDDNNITIDGPTKLSFTEDVLKRHEAYGWDVQSVDGHDYDAIDVAIKNAKANTQQPSLIACKTIIGFGSPNRAGTSKAHGEPLGADEVMLTKRALGLPENKSFYIAPGLYQLTEKAGKRGAKNEKNWEESFIAYESKNKKDAHIFKNCMKGEIPEEALNIPSFEPGTKMATRAASGKVLDYLAPLVPNFLGGSADLTPSNKTFPKSEKSYSPHQPDGRYIHYGVREHGMGGIMNGLTLHGGILPYGATFFVFTDYMRPAMRMAALMGIQVIYVMTHDSIGLGEDGPTHQPIAQLASFRAMPNMTTIRPMCGNETIEAWKTALNNKKGPTILVLTRQGLPIYNRAAAGMAPVEMAQKGGYVLVEDADFSSIIIATGSEVEIALDAKRQLNENGKKVRVVSMPCTDLFDQQPVDYREEVLPPSITNRVAIEAAAPDPWYKYVGLQGKVIGLERFGASAPYQVLYEKLGITAEAIVQALK